MIQSEAIYEVAESSSDTETSQTASDWIGALKGPNVCAQRFSCILPLHLMLISDQENFWEHYTGTRFEMETKGNSEIAF